MWDSLFWILIAGGIIFIIYDIWAVWKAGVSKTGFVIGCFLHMMIGGIVASSIALHYEWTVFCWWSMLIVFLIGGVFWKIYQRRKIKQRLK